MTLQRVLSLLLLLPAAATALSTPFSTSSSVPPASEAAQSVYWNQYTASQELDQACYESALFWEELDSALPGWRTDTWYSRFRGFCDNIKTERPGDYTFLPNGQQLLSQYVFPGISEDEDGVMRAPYPADDYDELRRLRKKLSQDVAPVARKELGALLSAKPVVNDDDGAVGDDGDTWQRAAWYGWQFLSLRGAKRFMPKSSRALKKAMGPSGPAHRFVGLARQKAQCRGVDHSDGRNYMLSTLTPLECEAGKCGIVVNDQDAALATGGSAVILDNTFVHHVYNDAETDRFCLMSECWHPALTISERDALSTFFAVKDRFTVVELRLAPWGYDDDSLEMALTSGAVHDLDFWKGIGYKGHKGQRRSTTAARGSSTPPSSSSNLSKKKRGGGKGFATAKAKGFGKP